MAGVRVTLTLARHHDDAHGQRNVRLRHGAFALCYRRARSGHSRPDPAALFGCGGRGGRGGTGGPRRQRAQWAGPASARRCPRLRARTRLDARRAGQRSGLLPVDYRGRHFSGHFAAACSIRRPSHSQRATFPIASLCVCASRSISLLNLTNRCARVRRRAQ